MLRIQSAFAFVAAEREAATNVESGIETIVLQAGVVIGSGSASFEVIRHLTDRLPVMTTPKWVHNSIQPMADAGAAVPDADDRELVGGSAQ